MANVNIKFNNKDYLLSCDDGQEESLKNLTKFLDKKYAADNPATPAPITIKSKCLLKGLHP